LAVRGFHDKRFPSLLAVQATKRRKAFTPRCFWPIQGLWSLALSSSSSMETVLCATGRPNGLPPATPVARWFSPRTRGRRPVSLVSPLGATQARWSCGWGRGVWSGRRPCSGCCGASAAAGACSLARSRGCRHSWRMPSMISSRVAVIGSVGRRPVRS